MFQKISFFVIAITVALLLTCLPPARAGINGRSAIAVAMVVFGWNIVVSLRRGLAAL